MKEILLSLLFVFGTVVVFILTKNPITGPFKLQLMLLSLIVLVVYFFIMKTKQESDSQTKTFAFLVTIFILFLVGATGWFFSPFFFTLYLSVIFLSFIYSKAVSLSYALVLVILFAFNIGEVDLTYDLLIVLSLLTTIPLSLYLRRVYLKLKDAQKEIMIMQEERDTYKDKLDEVLSNILVKFAVDLKQPVNDIKQMAFRLQDVEDKSEIKKYEERIIAASQEALDLIKEFEENKTGKKLLTTPKTP